MGVPPVDSAPLSATVTTQAEPPAGHATTVLTPAASRTVLLSPAGIVVTPAGSEWPLGSSRVV